MEKRNYKVYCHIHPDGRKYVGITKKENLNHRWLRGNGYRYNEYFYRSIKKVGWDSFKHIILAKNLTLNEAYKLEMFFIQKYKSYIGKYGFNLAMGGLSNIPNKEAKGKIRKNHAHLYGKDNPFYGKKHSEETKRLISQNHDYKKQTGLLNIKSKTVICFETLQLFESAHIASKYFKIGKDIIATKCRKLKPYKGLHFMYYDDFIEKINSRPLEIHEYLHNNKNQQNKYKNKYTLKLTTIFDYLNYFKEAFTHKIFSE